MHDGFIEFVSFRFIEFGILVVVFLLGICIFYIYTKLKNKHTNKIERKNSTGYSNNKVVIILFALNNNATNI